MTMKNQNRSKTIKEIETRVSVESRSSTGLFLFFNLHAKHFSHRRI